MLAFAAVACFGAADSAGHGTLIRNGGFGVRTDGGSPAGWTITGGYVSDRVGPSDRAEGGAAWDIQFNRPVTINQTVVVTPRSDLFFSIRVKSDARVVATVGRIRMAYSQLGAWETLVGRIPVADQTSLDVAIQVSSLGSEPSGRVNLAEAVLRPFERPETLGRKPVDPATPLVTSGTAVATIVYPAEPPIYREHAERVRDAVRARTGVVLPLATDVEATTPGPPVLRDELKRRPLIVLGRLGINRALWPAYNRYLAAVDGYYPGGDGYVLRTAVDPLRNGANHLIVGGSSDAGAGRAVEALVSQINDAPAGPTLTLPWLLRADLQGECLGQMRSHDALWEASPLDASLPRIEPGYGTVRRWYENAVGYYWTGWPSYRERARELIQPVLADRAYTHQYVAEFFARAVDMVEGTDLFDEPTRRGVERLVADNFLDFCTDVGGDLDWMATFAPPYDAIGITNRHQIAPWMADYRLAAYVADTFIDAGDLIALADYRRREKGSFFDYLVTQRWDTSLPGGVSTEHEGELAQSILRYALEHERYEFFESGNARHLPALERVDHLTGALVRPSGPVETTRILGALATYHRDGRYASVRESVPDLRTFMNRYVGGIHRYAPGAELPPADPTALAGVREPALMPHRAAHLDALTDGLFTAAEPPAKVLDFVSFRDGFAPPNDYVVLNGLATPVSIPGDISKFASRGVHWLGINGDTSYTAPSRRFADHNAVHVLRTDRWLGGQALYPATPRRDWVADLKSSGGAALTCEPFVDTRWERSVVWVRPGVVLVRDRVTALEEGTYQVAVNWWPLGDAAWDGAVWTSRRSGKVFRVTPLGDGFTADGSGADSASDSDTPKPLRLVRHGRLNAGESAVAYTLLQALDPATDSPLSMQRVGPDHVRLSDSQPAGGGGADVLWSPAAASGVTTDASVVVLGAGGCQMLDGTELQVGGEPILRLSQRGSAAIDLRGGRVRASAPRASDEPVEVAVGASMASFHETLPGDAEFRDWSIGSAATPRALAAWRERVAIPATATADGGPGAATPAGDPIEDKSAAWSVAWSYDGLRQPLRVEAPERVEPGVIDLGRPVRIAAIYPPPESGAWVPRRLPETIAYAPAHLGDNPPGPDGWRDIPDAPQWRPGARTGNYGQADAERQDSQVLTPADVTTRFLKGAGVERLVVLDADRLGVPEPLQLTRVRDDAGQPVLLVSPVLWPKFVGWQPPWRDGLALLGPDGRERFKATPATRLQAVGVLPLGAEGEPRVVTATIDGAIEVRDLSGRVVKDASLYELHQAFNQEFGRTNTRTPAGGYTMPFAVGAWRGAPATSPGLVVARYHAFSFLDHDLAFEGLRFDGSYVQPAMLPEGIDFDGDGAQEQLALGRGALLRLHGPLDRRVEQPDGYRFYPEVYHLQRLDEPAWDDRIDGAPVISFHPLAYRDRGDARPRYVFCARENYVAIYDGLENRWAFSWTPLTSLRGAAVIVDGPEVIRIVAATEDGLVWTLDWAPGQAGPRHYESRYLPLNVARVRADGASGALLSTSQGVYRLNAAGEVSRLATGDFADAEPVPDEPNSIFAVARNGEVRKYIKR